MRNQLIIFSKNRASQLNLLLESIELNASHLFDTINVVYKADEDYVSGYELLKPKFPSVIFNLERNFRSDVITLISEDTEFTTFLVDDVVIYDKITESKELILSSIHDKVCCFSLRLGLNCEYSHPANLSYKIKNYGLLNGMITFQHRIQGPGDFSYPLSTDGHIYKTEKLRDMLLMIPFTNPNSLEANLQRVIGSVPELMVSFEKSKLVSIPANLVNDSFKNRHGLQYYFSEKELNDRYLKNETIDLAAMDFTKINGPHKEIEYKFKNNGN